MSKSTNTKGNWKDLKKIYGIMFRYWPVLVTGLIAMLLYALFSGISITFVIPLFDYVFNPNKPAALYTTMGQFFEAIGTAWSSFMSEIGGIFAIKGLSDLAPFWESLKQIMLQTSSLSLLYAICLFVVITMVLKNVFYYIQRVLFVDLRGNTIRDVRNLMFSRYMRQSLEFFNQNRVGDALVRMVNDVEIVSEQFIRSLLEGIRDVVTILVYMRIALLMNSQLFLYSIIVLPAFSLSIGFLGKKIKKYSRRIQAQLSSMFSTVEEALNSMKIVKAFRREESEYKIFSQINKRHLKLWKKAQRYSALNVPLSEMTTLFTGVIVIVIGGRMILAPGSTFSLGDFTAFLFAMFSMLHPLNSLTQIYTDVKKALVSLGRISTVLNTESSVVEAEDAVEKKDFNREIVFDNVSFSYKGSKPVLHNVSLIIHKGEKIAFVGASGGGKTTLANLFNRMYDVEEGAILIDGIDIRKIKISDLRRLFGVVTQESVLFTRSVKENIAYGSLEEVSDEQIRKAAQIAHAEEFILNFPSQYDEILQTKGANLSGGQKQRLCIARAIVGDPPILIFDEATSALDTESEKLVQEAIDDATQNRTVIMIAHRLSTIQKADKIVVLEHGRIVGIGTHQELMESCPRYQKLYNLQYGHNF